MTEDDESEPLMRPLPDTWQELQARIADQSCYEEKPDLVNRPPHYTFGKIEVIDAIEAWGLGFHDGNVVKYVARHRHKNGVEDLKKAKWYLERLIAKCDGTPDEPAA